MDLNGTSNVLFQLIHIARAQAGRKEPITDELSFIRTELRQRRKHFLGSYISLQDLVHTDFATDDCKIKELSHYLADKTVLLWKRADPDTDKFSLQFYELGIYAICSGKVGNESVDDLIQLAECLVRSRDVFIDVMKNLLPADMIGELFYFTEHYEDSFYASSFEDAVLGAVSVFLGVLAEPAPANGAFI